jgi:hypothetical protein
MNFKKNYFLLTLFLLFSFMAKSQIDAIRMEARTVFLIGTNTDDLQEDCDVLLEGQQSNGRLQEASASSSFPIEQLEGLVTLCQGYATLTDMDPNHNIVMANNNLTTLKTGIVNGLDYWYQNVDYYESDESWWWNEIGKQRELHKISVLFYDHLKDVALGGVDPVLSAPIDAPEELFIGVDCQDPPGGSTPEICTIKEAISADFPITIIEPDDEDMVDEYTGANKADIAVSIIAKGMLENNLTWVDAGKDEIRCAMVFSTVVNPDHDYDGIREDFSFQQHNQNNGNGLLYAGGYGQSLIHNVGVWGKVFMDANYDFISTDKQIFFDFILKGYRRMIIGNTTDYSANGRYIVRNYPNNNAAISPEDMNLVISMAGGNSTEIGENLALMSANSVLGSRQSFEDKHYHFWKSDYVTHHESNYFTSVRMCSDRTIGTESLGGENQRGYCALWLYLFLSKRR